MIISPEKLSPKKLKEMEEDEHRAYHRRILYVVIVILLFLFGGALFYHWKEKWSYLDAVYFAAATMTTVGYGDITPHTIGGKIFTIVYLFTGVGIALYGISLMASHFVEIREQFWIERIARIKIKHHTATLWDKLKNYFNFKSGRIVKEYQKSIKK